jgi:hypothetical protein
LLESCRVGAESNWNIKVGRAYPFPETGHQFWVCEMHHPSLATDFVVPDSYPLLLLQV